VISLELNDERSSVCDCCGGTTTTLSRWVSKDDSAFALYLARFSDNHPDRSIVLLVSIEGWGTDDASGRFSVALEMRVLESGPAVMVVDAATSPWADESFLGQMLDRPTALAHAAIKDVFAITDRMVLDDPPLRAYLERAQSN
jgi:hypothetical protein